MNPPRPEAPLATPARPRRQRRPGRPPGFSLVEVVLSVGIVAFVLVALLGLLTVGMGSLRDSGNETLTGMIFRDVRERMMGSALQPTSTPVLFYYDRNGTLLDETKPADAAQNYYRVEVLLKTPVPAPLNTAAGSVLSASVSVAWPAATVANGAVPSGAQAGNQASASFLVTSDSTASWKALDGTFTPRVAF